MRSNSGLSNRSLFTDAIFTLYVEGGGGQPGKGSTDVVFWRAIFTRLRPEIRITISVLGGKPQLETIAKKVASNDVRNSIVAMDADFDELLNEKIQSPFVIYTYGYSWENDVFYGPSLILAIERLLHMDQLPSHVLEGLTNSYEELLHGLRPFVNIDFYLRALKTSLFPQMSPGHFISHDPATAKPFLNTLSLRKKYIETLRKVPVAKRRNRPKLSIIDTASYTQGHAIEFLMRKVVAFAVRLGGRTMNVNDDLLFQTIVPAFCDATLGSTLPIRSYYTNMLQNITSQAQEAN
ncbi:hypothetical protein FHX14_001896 [Rhizobium sp. BK619]|uniref:DUF4435 domain-containing protein n=1 Tax=Rhizobium sp. BK619 TaxID=2586989 RepID=UPI001619D6BE|nr:DUF4435 domain-containing protein [Rhizobium sp. BK619]MBB3645717.1 hypothetical protein [Rhizobium sp. BK619]